MKLLTEWTQAPVAIALGYTLLHSLWEATLIAALLALTLSVLRSSKNRYLAACAAFLSISAAFGLTLLQELADNSHSLRSAAGTGSSTWRVVTGWPYPSPSGLGFAALIPWLAPIWTIGVCFLSLRHVAGWIGANRLRHRGACTPPSHWHASLSKLADKLQLSKPVILLESCLTQTPLVLGYLRPVILIPIGLLTGLPVSQVEAILAHELAHIRRNDYLINSLQRLLECFFFYHPAVWWIAHIIRTERENCCDDMVIALGGDPLEYATALTSLEETRISGRAPALAATGGNLMQRVRRLLYPQRPSGAWTSLSAAAILIATATVALAAWQSESAKPVSADQWLNHDVVYIINDQERAAFQKLNTEDEKQMFIQQFWLRRDPTPNTPVNEFKDEHYRRLAYATKHFQTASGRPGWQTDRGHMYILYGPPDEIDSHPAAAHAYESWQFRHVEGVGDNLFLTFVDPSKTGDYTLAPGRN